MGNIGSSPQSGTSVIKIPRKQTKTNNLLQKYKNDLDNLMNELKTTGNSVEILQKFQKTKKEFVTKVLNLAQSELKKNRVVGEMIKKNYGNVFLVQGSKTDILKNANNVIEKVKIRLVAELYTKVITLSQIKNVEIKNKEIENALNEAQIQASAVEEVVNTSSRAVGPNGVSEVTQGPPSTVPTPKLRKNFSSLQKDVGTISNTGMQTNNTNVTQNMLNNLKKRSAAFVGSVPGLSNKRKALNDPKTTKEVETLELKKLLKNLGMNNTNYNNLKLENMNFDKAKQKINLIKLLRNRGHNNTVYERFKNNNFNKAKGRILALKAAKKENLENLASPGPIEKPSK